MKNALLILLFLGVLSSCEAQVAEKLAPEVFKAQYENESNAYQIIDLRTDEEVAEGKVSGATQLDFYSDDFEENLQKLDKSVTYYIYCRSGGRSGKTLSKMKELGFDKVYDMQGGMNAWLASGFPTE